MTQRGLDWRSPLVLLAGIFAVIGAFADHYNDRWLAGAIVTLCIAVLL